MSYTDDFENLVKSNESEENDREYNAIKFSDKPLKADKNASLFDFIKMVEKMCTRELKDVKFIPDEGKNADLDSLKKINNSIITYKVISRKVKNENKPRLRESIFPENKQDGQIKHVWGQKFKCMVQFNIFASVYTTAEEVMKKFEDMMITATAYFKKNGVAEIFFYNQFTDEAYQNLRQTLSVRNLQYYVEIENQTVIVNEKIKEIISFDE